MIASLNILKDIVFVPKMDLSNPPSPPFAKGGI